MKTQEIFINGKKIDFVIDIDDDYIDSDDVFYDDEDTLDLSDEINKIKEMNSIDE